MMSVVFQMRCFYGVGVIAFHLVVCIGRLLVLSWSSLHCRGGPDKELIVCRWMSALKLKS